RRIRLELGDIAVVQAIVVTSAILPLGGLFTLLQIVFGHPRGGFFGVRRTVAHLPILRCNSVERVPRPESRPQGQQDNQHPPHSSDAHLVATSKKKTKG